MAIVELHQFRSVVAWAIIQVGCNIKLKHSRCLTKIHKETSTDRLYMRCILHFDIKAGYALKWNHCVFPLVDTFDLQPYGFCQSLYSVADQMSNVLASANPRSSFNIESE